MRTLPWSRLAVIGALVGAFVLATLSTFVASAQHTTSTTAANSPITSRAASITPPTAPLPDVTSAASPAGTLPGTRLNDVITSGRLVVAVVNLDRYPFFYTDAKGNLVGSDIDLSRDIARELGVEATFDRSAATFDGVIDLVAQGKADVGISKLSITLPRALHTRFTRSYIDLAQGLLLNRVRLTAAGGNDKDVISVLNRQDRRLGAVKGTSYVGFGHTMYPQAEIVEYPDKESMFAAVLAGDVIGALYDENEIKQYIFRQPDRLINLKVQMLPGRTDPIGVAVSDSALQYWLNTYLELKGVKLSVNELLTKYPRPEGK